MTNADLGKHIKGFTPEVEQIFSSYVWYGNLRELKNVIKRAALLTDQEWIEARTLPFEISNFSKLQFNVAHDSIPPADAPVREQEEESTPPRLLPSLRGAGIDAEYEMILSTLKKVNFNKSKAAKLLQIDRKTLYNKLEQYQLLK